MYSDRFLQLIDPPPTEITYKLWFLDIYKSISRLELLVFLEMFMSCRGGSRIFHLSTGRGGGVGWGGVGGVQLEIGGTDGWLTQTWKANNEAIT